MKTWLLAQIMQYLVGKDVFGQIQKLVAEVAFNTTLSGSEKRAKVLEDLKGIAGGLASHLINLAIEAAVTLLKSKTQ